MTSLYYKKKNWKKTIKCLIKAKTILWYEHRTYPEDLVLLMYFLLYLWSNNYKNFVDNI